MDEASTDQTGTLDAPRRYSYTASNLFTVIVEHPGWARPKVLDMLALSPQDASETTLGLYGDSARVGVINPAIVLMQAVIDMPRVPTARLFWAASRNGAEGWIEAEDRGAAARAHQQRTGQPANLVLPADDLVQEALRLNGLLETNDARMVVSPKLLVANAEV